MLYQTRKLDVHSNGVIRTEELLDAAGARCEVRIYHENGALRYAIPYVNGCAHGIECRYDENGALCMEVAWDKDELHGATYAYDALGAVEYTQLYRHGELVDLVFA